MKNDECTDDRIDTIEEVIFGNPKTGEKGMKEKVDEMHELLLQAQGWKKLGYSILLIAGVLAALKGWFK
jgi:hypothetical protein